MPDQNQHTIVGLGELLWDLLPAGKQLGGAPANFAYWSTMLGNRGVVASRVGDDETGREAIDRLAKAGVGTSHLQFDRSRATGTVRVEVGDSGQPEFAIAEPVAWDFMEWTREWEELAASADAICFGTLAQRSQCSRETIARFIQGARDDAVIVFDVNLRQRFYSKEIIVESLKRAQVAKLNSDELSVVMSLLGLARDNEIEAARLLLGEYDLDLICVTRGDRGSLLVRGSEVVEHGGFSVRAVDTVGSGDAFTAVLVHHCLKRTPLERISEAANRLGSWLATQAGAMPVADRSILSSVL